MKQLNLFEMDNTKIWRAWQIVHKTHDGRPYNGDKVWFLADMDRDQVLRALEHDGYRGIQIVMCEKEKR